MRFLMLMVLALAGACAWLPRTNDPAPASEERCEALDGSRWNSRQGCVAWNGVLLERLEERRRR